MTHFQIRQFTEQDIPAAMGLKNALGWNQTPVDWKRFLLLSGDGFFKAELGGRLAATGIVFFFERLAWVSMLIVKAEYRGRGIGRALMEKCLMYCSSRRAVTVKLDSTEQGFPLYRKLGFF